MRRVLLCSQMSANHQEIRKLLAMAQGRMEGINTGTILVNGKLRRGNGSEGVSVRDVNEKV